MVLCIQAMLLIPLLVKTPPMEDRRPSILEVTPEELLDWLREAGEPAYRLTQILSWVYERRAGSFDAMTNLGRDLRTRLAESFSLAPLRVIGQERSRDGASEKYLFELADGEQIESVRMGGDGHHAFCISSQAGCALGCLFCATGGMGFGRNLTVAEILGQVTALAGGDAWPANIVFMGMGEPLLNLEAVVPALEALADERRFGLGLRRITVSTAGVTPGIKQLAAAPVQPNLALSLNSPFDEERSRLMPINRKYPLRGVLAACRDYVQRTGRRLTLEYVLLGGVNTSPPAAREVARIAHEQGALVNLIAFNPVKGCAFESPHKDEVSRFRSLLEERGVRVTQRFRRGLDVAAGCGQLKGKHPTRNPGGTP